MHNTIYPHPCQIQKVTPWPQDPSKENRGKGVAAVLLRYGPVSVRARLVNGEKGLFLSMPARKDESTGEYWNHAFITDRTLLETFEALAISEYHKELGVIEPIEIAA